jgi:sporulation protein YlmC with PRC-barrel domain
VAGAGFLALALRVGVTHRRGREEAMGALDIDAVLDWRGRTVVDRNGEKIGTLREIYLDADERPAWASVHTALFGLRETFVPLSEARRTDDRVQVPYEREHVKQAPNVDPDVQLSGDEEERLYRHYGMAAEAEHADPAEVEPAAEASAPDDAMTRSEEELQIGKRRRVRGRARLKKYVVTDYVEKKVPVRREEVRLEREPAGGDDPAA